MGKQIFSFLEGEDMKKGKGIILHEIRAEAFPGLGRCGHSDLGSQRTPVRLQPKRCSLTHCNHAVNSQRQRGCHRLQERDVKSHGREPPFPQRQASLQEPRREAESEMTRSESREQMNKKPQTPTQDYHTQHSYPSFFSDKEKLREFVTTRLAL